MNTDSSGFKLVNELGYFQNKGVDVMAFDDIYPEGHQSGVSIIMHGKRVATNGDIRFDKLPGQWEAVPEQRERKLDDKQNTITTRLVYPDEKRKTGFNPVSYPDIHIDYNIIVRGEGDCVIISVDFTEPLPENLAGKVSFLLELYPGELFGKPWIMDSKHGIFPVQANGPLLSVENAEDDAESGSDTAGMPYSSGRRLVVRPDDPYSKLVIETQTNELHLYDERMRNINGWFAVSSDVLCGVTKDAVKWIITPNVVCDWLHTPVIQFSQVGYHPCQPKVAIIELDNRDTNVLKPGLYKISEAGETPVLTSVPEQWGRFLRYNYLKFDFSSVTQDGLYKIKYGNCESSVFSISQDIYQRGVWQPVLEYFLPVQMCHMKVSENSRVWHGLCHMDDARMAPTDHIHFDGYRQGGSTLTKYKPGDIVPGLNTGGWHDAGDDDLRIESQAGECYILSLAFEEFGVYYDTTTIDQDTHTVLIHQPDGKNDILQQIEHGALSVLGAFKALGRLYRGIIVSDIKQYVMLGDTSLQTDNVISDDDRWVFTEDNPWRELESAAYLSAVSRALHGFNDSLSNDALEAAVHIFDITDTDKTPDTKHMPWIREDAAKIAKIHAASELYLSTKDDKYKSFLLSQTDLILSAMDRLAWCIARTEHAMGDYSFSEAFRSALPALCKRLDEQKAETPYGVPYRPHIWGAGWQIQRQGFEYYFLHKAYPDIFDADMVFDSLNFVLGCHPGSNNMSFASGVGAKSALIAYGWNRADWSFCPGGVISGTALIRPDFPELLDFPFLWQQTEYVLGGGSSHYMFLVLAAQHILKDK